MEQGQTNIEGDLLAALTAIRDRAITARRQLSERPDLNGRKAIREIEEQADSALHWAEQAGLTAQTEVAG